ncbi:MAG: hypothetical protein ABH868_01030 [bacterium]
MKSFFMSFLVCTMILSIFGAKLITIAGHAMRDVLELKEEFSSSKLSEKELSADPEYIEELLSKHHRKYKEAAKYEDEDVGYLLDQIEAEQTIITNPLMEKLKNMGKDTDEKEITTVIKFWVFSIINKIEYSNNFIGSVFLVSAVLIFVLVFITSGGQASGVGYTFARLGFNVSRLLIFFGAFFSLIIWFSLEYNIYMGMAGIILWGPFSVLIFSAIALKVYDFNNPIWNRMFISTIWPLMAGLIIHAF